MLNYQWNANQNHYEMSPHTYQNGYYQKTTNKCWWGCRGKRVLYTVNRDVNYCSHFKTIWSFLEKFKIELPYNPVASQVALVVKNPHASSGDIRDTGLIPGSGRSPGEGSGNPLQYSCLEYPTDRGAWWATAHGNAKSQAWLKQKIHSLTIQSSNSTPGYLTREIPNINS